MFHDLNAFKYTMALLLALARRTGRIFIMPKILADHGAHYLWHILDFSTVEEMGIEYRETNFPHNPKSWRSEEVPFQSVARTAVGSIMDPDAERTMYVQLPNNNGDPSEGAFKAWNFTDDVLESDALDTWWAMHTAIPDIDSAELLLVNPHILNDGFTLRLDGKLNRKDPSLLSIAEMEILAVYKRLKWCFDGALPIVIYENVIGRSSPEYDCFGKGQ